MFADRSIRRPFLTAAVLAGLASLTGCATIVHGTHQDVKIRTNPDHALVHLNGKAVGKTPFTASVSRHPNQTIKLTHDGYRPYIVYFTHHHSAAVYGNILLGGLVGGATDSIDGANGYQTPKAINVTMTPLAPGMTQAEATPVVFTPVKQGRPSSGNDTQGATGSGHDTQGQADNGSTHHHNGAMASDS